MKIGNYKTCLTMLIMVGATALTSCTKDDGEMYAMDNQDFVTKASSSNNFEVSAGALAVTKAENADVKHYGEHMVTDHTTAGLEMQNLASSKGWTVPTNLQPKEQQNLDKLAALSGSAFDKEFVNIMVLSHQDAVRLFETASSGMGVPDVDLRSLASRKLPTLKEHLQSATELKVKVNP
jgi:putative membrane protein